MTTIRGLVIDIDGSTRVLDMQPGETLKPLQETVGGWIEAVSSDDDTVTFWCDEEGKIKGLPMNGDATRLWWQLNPAAAHHDVLCGPVVLTGGTDSAGETMSLPDVAHDSPLAQFMREHGVVTETPLDTFWKAYESATRELAAVTTVDQVIEVCYRHFGKSSGDAFYPGGSGDVELLSVLQDTGWNPLWVNAYYYFCVRQPDGKDAFTYIEGDIVRGVQKPM